MIFLNLAANYLASPSLSISTFLFSSPGYKIQSKIN